MSRQATPLTISEDRLDQIAADAVWARNMDGANAVMVEMRDLYPLIIAARALAKAAPVSPDSDLLKEAVGLLRGLVETPAADYDAATEADQIRAFLSKVEERGHDAPQNPATEGVGS